MSPRPRVIIAAKFGDWELVSKIGAGGNGEVWRAVHLDSTTGAIKFLHQRHIGADTRYQRFLAEIDAMTRCRDIPGLLPLLDHHVPSERNADDRPWLVTPIAVPLEAAIGPSPSLEEVVTICHSLAETLAEMHDRGIAHRDVKPENVFRHIDRWCLGDLGLAEFPEKPELTAETEKLGPIFYIAPEMLNDAGGATGGPADVYSLAKLVWKLGTGQRYPLPQQLRAAEPATSLSAYISHPGANTLDHLLDAATHPDPHKRPTMRAVATALALWLEPPSLVPAEPLDLSHLTKRLTQATQPLADEGARRSAVDRIASTHMGRVLGSFDVALRAIDDAIERAYGKVHSQTNSGGTARFYPAKVDGPENTRTYTDSAHRYTVRQKRRTVVLHFGATVGVTQHKRAGSLTKDVYAPAVAAAAYLLEVHDHTQPLPPPMMRRRGQPVPEVLWQDSDTFYLGQPSEDAVVERLKAGLIQNLQRAMERLVEALDPNP